MSLVRYEPWNLLHKFHEDLDTLFNESPLGRQSTGDVSTVATSAWAPAVDIKEEADKFVLTADVPGVDPKDIEVSMDNGVLTIKGERAWKEEQEREGYRRIERAYGQFYRRFSLPDTADAERISAKGKNGVLEIVIPKQEKTQPRRIEVGA